MKSLADQLKDRVQKSEHFDFPGFRIRAFYQGQECVDLAVGKVHQYYDLASLTKIVFTTTYFAEAVFTKKLKLKDRVGDHLPWFKHPQIQIGQLLNHSAGNLWWQPFYKKIDRSLDPSQRFQQLERLVRDAPRGRGRQAVYSDLDFFVLGALMQKVEQAPLLEIWQRLHSTYFPQSDLHFCPGPKAARAVHLYAPTEACPWRRKTLRGEVHDENAWALGGVAPHAGLFARIEDLATYGLWLRSLLRQREKGGLAATMGVFCSRSLPPSRGDWAYGFMMPAQVGSSAGQHFSRSSVGHTGFAGTSLWYDPDKDLLVCLLSNRVHPTRKQRGFVHLRPLLHDWIVELLEDIK